MEFWRSRLKNYLVLINIRRNSFLKKNLLKVGTCRFLKLSSRQEEVIYLGIIKSLNANFQTRIYDSNLELQQKILSILNFS